MHLFKSVVVCVAVVAICERARSQPASAPPAQAKQGPTPSQSKSFTIEQLQEFQRLSQRLKQIEGGKAKMDEQMSELERQQRHADEEAAEIKERMAAEFAELVVAGIFSTSGVPDTALRLPESADSLGMKFKLIPAGDFLMGSPRKDMTKVRISLASGIARALIDRKSDYQHRVRITKPFKMGIHEVTQVQYEQVMGVNPSRLKGADNPVEMVSWDDAVEFCRKLSELRAEKAAGNVYRLPTEAEWEYACRAGTKTAYSFGDDASDLGDYAWYEDNSGGKPHPVGRKLPNAWGLYDMHGNVWEWCQDWYDDYPSGAVTDPTGPEAEKVASEAQKKAFKTADKNSDGYIQIGEMTDSEREFFTKFDTNKDDQISVTELVNFATRRVVRGVSSASRYGVSAYSVFQFETREGQHSSLGFRVVRSSVK